MTYTEIGKALFKSERWIEECVKAIRNALEDVPTREVVAAAKEAGWTWVPRRFLRGVGRRPLQPRSLKLTESPRMPGNPGSAKKACDSH